MSIGDAIAGALMGIGQSAPQLGEGVGRYITEREYAPLREKASKIISQLTFGNQQQAEAQAAGATSTTPATSAATTPTTPTPTTPATPPTGPSTSPVVNAFAGFTSTPSQSFDATIPSTAPTTAPTAAPSADNRDFLISQLRDTLSQLEGSPEEQDRAFSRQATTWLMTEEQRRQETAQRQAEADKERAHRESMQAVDIAARASESEANRAWQGTQSALDRAQRQQQIDQGNVRLRMESASNPNITVNERGEVADKYWYWDDNALVSTTNKDEARERGGVPLQVAITQLQNRYDFDKLEGQQRATAVRDLVQTATTAITELGLEAPAVTSTLGLIYQWAEVLRDGTMPSGEIESTLRKKLDFKQYVAQETANMGTLTERIEFLNRLEPPTGVTLTDSTGAPVTPAEFSRYIGEEIRSLRNADRPLPSIEDVSQAGSVAAQADALLNDYMVRYDLDRSWFDQDKILGTTIVARRAAANQIIQDFKDNKLSREFDPIVQYIEDNFTGAIIRPGRIPTPSPDSTRSR